MLKQPENAACRVSRARIAIMAAAMLLTMLSHTALQASDQKQHKGGALMTDNANPNIGKKFPAVTAETLEGNRHTVPDDARGKVTLVTVAFLRESQSQLDSWLNPFYEKFGTNPEIMFYEVPMISSGYRFMKFIIDRGMRGGLPKFKHKHVVTMYGDVEKYTSALNLDPRHGYAFLLDREGIIQWQAQGFSNPDLLAALFGKTEALLK